MNARGHCRMREREEDFCMREKNIFKTLNVHFSYMIGFSERKLLWRIAFLKQLHLTDARIDMMEKGF